MFIKLTFDNAINTSVQVGDYIYAATPLQITENVTTTTTTDGGGGAGVNVLTLSGIGTATNPNIKVGDKLVSFETDIIATVHVSTFDIFVTAIDYTTGVVNFDQTFHAGGPASQFYVGLSLIHI